MADTIVERLRGHANAAHCSDCPKPCDCDYSKMTDELLREAAARVEVTLEALAAAIDHPVDAVRWAKAARYALTTERREPFVGMAP